jgi:hypothetical protein
LHGHVGPELCPLQHSRQLGQEPGADGDLEALLDHRLPELRWAALRSDEGGYEDAGVEDDPLHYETALPESPHSWRMALSSSYANVRASSSPRPASRFRSQTSSVTLP